MSYKALDSFLLCMEISVHDRHPKPLCALFGLVINIQYVILYLLLADSQLITYAKTSYFFPQLS